MQELWLMRSARCLMLIDNYMKFCEDSLNVFFTLMDTIFLTESKENNLKS